MEGPRWKRHTEASCKSGCGPLPPSQGLAAGSGGSGPSLMEFTTCLAFVPNRPHVDTVHGRLGVLSEESVQRCLQLSSSQQNSQSRETLSGCRQRELERLRRENQVYTFNVEYTP